MRPSLPRAFLVNVQNVDSIRLGPGREETFAFASWAQREDHRKSENADPGVHECVPSVDNPFAVVTGNNLNLLGALAPAETAQEIETLDGDWTCN